MSAQAMPLTTKISQATGGETKPRLMTTNFGGGYEQRVPAGINYTQERWTIIWENITQSEVNTILTTFTDARNGADYHTWTAPGNTTSKKYAYEGHNIEAKAGGIYSITAAFRQVYDL